MNFIEASISGFQRYFEFSGRSSRSEYWYWSLFTLIASIILTIADSQFFGYSASDPYSIGYTSTLFGLLTIIPWLALACRRLHDVGRSGWWQLIAIIPIIGWILLLIWFCTRSTDGANKYGDEPLNI